jgi:hypothetical protein
MKFTDFIGYGAPLFGAILLLAIFLMTVSYWLKVRRSRGISGFRKISAELPPCSGYYRVKDELSEINIAWFDAEQKKFTTDCSEFGMSRIVGWKYLPCSDQNHPVKMIELNPPVTFKQLAFVLGVSDPDTKVYSSRRQRFYDHVAATALIVQDQYKGKILGCQTVGCGDHYWNQLPDGNEIDLTLDQFLFVHTPKRGEKVKEFSREEILADPKIAARYAELSAIVQKSISPANMAEAAKDTKA